MRLTVLGKSPSWQDAGGACSGYLIEEDGSSVLLDCGNGVFSKLRALLRLHRRRRRRDLAPARGPLPRPRSVRLRAHLRAAPAADAGRPLAGDRQAGAPEAATPRVEPRAVPQIVGAWGNEDLIENAFDLEEFAPDSMIEVGTMQFRFQDVPHFTADVRRSTSARPTAAAASPTGPTARPNEQLVEFAKDSDLLIVEATLPRPERTGIRGHLTPEEAAEHASAPASSACSSPTSPTSWTSCG